RRRRGQPRYLTAGRNGARAVRGAERLDLTAQDVALAGSAAIDSANDPVGEIVDVHEIQSQGLEHAIAQPALRECAAIRADRGMVVRSVYLAGLDDHDRRSALCGVERDVVSSPLGVLIGGRRR